MRPTSRLTAMVSAMAITATSLVVTTDVASATAAPAAVFGVNSDFNGDGIADAAITDQAAGGIRIIYGTRSGLTVTASGTARKNQLIPAPDLDPATNLVTGDFNGDGYADLAISDPGASDGSVADAGAVRVYYGSATGVGTAASIIKASEVSGYTPVAGDDFGQALSVGDFNGDGYADLVVGVPLHNNGSGEVFVMPGSSLLIPGGAGTARLFSEGDGVIPGARETGDGFGYVTTAGDFNGDGLSDLAIGDPGEDNSEGAVFVVRGTTGGALLTETGRQTWMQGSGGILGSASAGDSFGDALAVGSFKGNGRTDLAVGAPDDSVGSAAGAGAINVLYSAGTSGLSSTGNQLWTQNSSGLGTAAQAYGFFGASLTTGDFNGDGRADLADGVWSDSIGSADQAGAVQIIAGSASGLTATGSQFWSQQTAGIPGVSQSGDYFGNRVIALNVTSASRSDLLIAVKGEVLGTSLPYVGEVQFLHSSTSGLTATGNQEFDNGTPGFVGPTPGGGQFAVTVS